MKVNSQRFSHHGLDMEHAHLVESRRVVELNDPPSMLRRPRRGYATTAASYRGEQLEGAAFRGSIAAHDPRGAFCVSTLRYLGTLKPDYEPPAPAKPYGPDLPGLNNKHNFLSPLNSTVTVEWATSKLGNVPGPVYTSGRLTE
jgi:hypothetical protein